MIAALIVQLLSTFGAPSPRGSAETNVLVILADDLGQEPVGATWSVTHPLMPTLADLAAEGVAFSRAYSWPVCSTTRFAAMWGRYPRRANVMRPGIDHPIGFGDVSLNSHLPDDDRVLLELVSLPERFALTHWTALFGKYHLGRAPGVGTFNHLTSGPQSHGFDKIRAVNLAAPAAGGGAAGYYQWLRDNDGALTISATYATAEQRDELLAWWSATTGPKFAVLGTSDTHEPVTDANAPPGFIGTGNTRLNYEQHVAYLDSVLAQILATVNLSETIVVFSGDNGVFDAARPTGTLSGYWKGSTYEGGVRVPLVIAGPGIAGGGVTDRIVSLLDLPATLSEMVDLCGPTGFEDACSFADELGTLWAGTAPRAFVFTERYETFAGGVVQPDGYDDLAIIEDETTFGMTTAKWKLRRWDADGDGPGTTIDRIYNLKTDPFEQAPILPTAPGVGAVYTRLTGYLATLPPRAQ